MGGWTSTVTQNTVITPIVVKKVLKIMNQFTIDFNLYLSNIGLKNVSMGKPTGSTTYHDIDPDDKIYGDIDLQMIGPEMDDAVGYSAYTNNLNKLACNFIKTHNLSYVHPTESSLGHPIIEFEPGKYVQVDFMWHPTSIAVWGAARVTPEHGVKGLLCGNMFSAFGEIMDMSIQHVGVQLKVSSDNIKVPFNKRKDTRTITISIDPVNFILHIFNWIANRQGISNPKIDEELILFSGLKTDMVKISDLVRGIKGFAKSCQINDMFGKGDLMNFTDDNEFITNFINRYTAKAEADINSTKRNKANTHEAISKANSDREKVETGLNMVLKYFTIYF